MKHLLARFFPQGENTKNRAQAPRLSFDSFPEAIYAVGDVHGRLDLLLKLEDAIAAHAARWTKDVWIVLLGDYIDRGPESAQTLEHLINSPKHGFQRICLSGNHEHAMLEALSNPKTFSWWCRYGGLETLASYGVSLSSLDTEGHDWETIRRALSAYIPHRHRDFLTGLPVLLQVPGYIFVHAGLVPGVPLQDQSDYDLRWVRDAFLQSDHDFDHVVVHGHTIVEHVTISGRRIAVDTGAYQTGRLSAVCLTASEEPHIITVAS